MQAGLIDILQIQKEKKGPFELVPFLRLEEGEGIIGDCHYGEESKQLSLLPSHIMQWIKSQEVPGLCFDKFNANIITKGIDFCKVVDGDILVIEDVRLLVSMGTKQCFSDCKRLQQELPCDLSNGIAFARVLRSGVIKIGDMITIE